MEMDPNQIPQAPVAPQPNITPQPIPPTTPQPTAPAPQPAPILNPTPAPVPEPIPQVTPIPQPDMQPTPQSAAMPTPPQPETIAQPEAAQISAAQNNAAYEEATTQGAAQVAAPADDILNNAMDPTPTTQPIIEPTPANPQSTIPTEQTAPAAANPQPAAPAEQPVMPTPQPSAPNQQTANTESKPASKFDIKRILMPIMAVACIVLVVVIGVVLYNALSGPKLKKGEKAMLSEAAFIPKTTEKDSKYALFDKNGKQLTEFDIKDHETIVAGYALIQNDNDEYAVINQKGKITIDWQKSEIEQYGGLFLVYVNDDEGILVTGKGEQVDVIDKDSSVENMYSSPITIVYHKDTVNIFSAYGDQLDTINGSEDDCDYSTSQAAIAVICKDALAVFDAYDLKEVFKTSTSNQYDSFYASQNNDIYAFSSFNYGLYNKKNDKGTAVYSGGKFIELGDRCDSVYATNPNRSEEKNDGGYASCTNDDGTFLIAADGHITDIEVSENTVYNPEHYIKYDADGEKAEFYVNGSKVGEAKATSRPTISYASYVIEDDDNVSIYDLSGKQIFTTPYKYSAEVYGVDNYGLIAINTSDGDNRKAMLVNTKGKTLLDGDYAAIVDEGHGYYNIIKSEDDNKKKSLANSKGKLIIEDANCSYIAYVKYIETLVCTPQSSYSYDDKKDEDLGKYIFYDKNGKELFSAEGEMSFMDNYYIFGFEKDDVVNYYTNKGKLVYTSK